MFYVFLCFKGRLFHFFSFLFFSFLFSIEDVTNVWNQQAQKAAGTNAAGLRDWTRASLPATSRSSAWAERAEPSCKDPPLPPVPDRVPSSLSAPPVTSSRTAAGARSTRLRSAEWVCAPVGRWMDPEKDLVRRWITQLRRGTGPGTLRGTIRDVRRRMSVSMGITRAMRSRRSVWIVWRLSIASAVEAMSLMVIFVDPSALR